MIDHFLGDAFEVLFACFEVLFRRWYSAADTYLKLLDCVVSGALFLSGCVFEFDIVHRRSVYAV